MSAIRKMDSGVTPNLVAPSFKICMISFLPFKLAVLTSGRSTGLLGIGVVFLVALATEDVPLGKVGLGACLRVVISAESLLFLV